MSTLAVATIKSKAAATAPVIQDSAGTEIGQFVRAWVNFNGTGTVAIRGSFNISSITDNAVGDFTMNFATALPSANYAATTTCRGGAASGGVTLNMLGAAPTTTQFRFLTHTISNTVPWNSASADGDYVLFAALGG